MTPSLSLGRHGAAIAVVLGGGCYALATGVADRFGLAAVAVLGVFGAGLVITGVSVLLGYAGERVRLLTNSAWALSVFVLLGLAIDRHDMRPAEAIAAETPHVNAFEEFRPK